MNEFKRRPLRVVSVHVDIVDFLWETERVLRLTDDCVVSWLQDLRESLAKRDPTISEYGAKLLHEVEAFREFDRNRKKKNSTESKESKESTENPKSEEAPTSENPKDEKPDPLLNPESIESIFEEARKAFPGRKGGFEIEFKNFLTKCGNRKRATEEVVKLLPGIEAEKADRIEKTKARAFVPEWKHFKTWINARAWTQEFEAPGTAKPAAAPSRREIREAGYKSGYELAERIKNSAGLSTVQPSFEVLK